MKTYNVLKECILNHKYYQPGECYKDPYEHGDKSYLREAEKHGFIKLIVDNYKPNWGVVAKSKLANIEVADTNYTEGEKKYFTFDEALEIEKKLKKSGWRLPTRSEWVLLAEEFGQENGLLNAETIIKNLKLPKEGYQSINGYTHDAGNNGRYWSSTAYSITSRAYALNFDSGVNPSLNSNRYDGMSVRCVRDLEVK